MHRIGTKVAIVVGALLAMGLAVPARGGIISDSFTLVSGPRDAGDPLNGTTTEVGGVTWTASAVVFGGDATNGFVQTNHTTTRTALVPLSDAGSVVTIGGDVSFAARSTATSWGIYIGFNDTNALSSSDGLYVQLRQGGFWRVLNNNLSLGQGQLTDFDPAAWTSVEMAYDLQADTITVTIGGTAVLTDAAVTTEVPVNYGGIIFDPNNYNTETLSGNRVDNFYIIPEPASLALTAAGLLLIMPGRRRCPR